MARLRELADREAARGRLGVGGEATAAALYYYFTQSLRYILGPAEWEGLRRFHELCVQHELVPPGPPPAPAVD